MIAGTATSVSNRVSRRQAARWSAQDQQQQYAEDPYAQQAPMQQAGGGEDRLQMLKELGELKATGVLTDAEFEAQKAKILAG